MLSKKAKELVSKEKQSGKIIVEIDEDKLTEDETIEYEALSDLAFLNMWDERFRYTLKAVSTIKQELMKNLPVVKIDKDGDEPEYSEADKEETI